MGSYQTPRNHGGGNLWKQIWTIPSAMMVRRQWLLTDPQYHTNATFLSIHSRAALEVLSTTFTIHTGCVGANMQLFLSRYGHVRCLAAHSFVRTNEHSFHQSTALLYPSVSIGDQQLLEEYERKARSYLQQIQKDRTTVKKIHSSAHFERKKKLLTSHLSYPLEFL